MIQIQTTEEAIEKLADEEIEIEVLKDILFQAFLMDTQFKGCTDNKIIILKSNEEYVLPDLVPEIDETVGNFRKILYITCDTGEGIVIYWQKGAHNE